MQAMAGNSKYCINKDVFFLNIVDAYAEAQKQNKFIDDTGVERLQYCYYDGPLTDITLENFIRIPADNLVVTFSENNLPIPQLIAVSRDTALDYEEMPADVIDEIQNYRLQRNLIQTVHRDIYFVDPLLALNVAKQKNRIYCGHPTIDGLQVCYYRGSLPEHTIDNIIHLELEAFVDFFIGSRFRLPEHLEMPDELEAELKESISSDLAYLVNKVKQTRLDLVHSLAARAKSLIASIDPGRPLRVFVASSRLTTVMQYASANVAKAFENMGYEVLFYIEENAMSGSNLVDYLMRYISFNPHIVFNVNNLNNYFLNDQVINLIWWQDPMPSIKQHQLLAWRPNDFNFSISPVLDEHLEKCGASKIIRQQFVIDDQVFNTDVDVTRENKVVFVGSSYRTSINPADEKQQQVIQQLLAYMQADTDFSTERLMALAEQFSLSYDFVYWRLWHYVIRDYTVRWLCENSFLPVEVYGRYWANDPLVSRHYKNELQHGVEVANLYRSAKYALVSHPFEINSQRLAEVAACGCIPIVYDCRDIAEPPHWDDSCLFFKTQADLHRILKNEETPAQSPLLIVEKFTYKHAVENFIKNSNIKNLRL